MLVNTTLARDDLAAGRLVRPLTASMALESGYWLLTPGSAGSRGGRGGARLAARRARGVFRGARWIRAARGCGAAVTDGPRDRAHGGAGRDNRRAVLGAVLLSGPLSRAAVSGRTGLGLNTVSRIARELIAEGLLRELPGRRGARGRREAPLDIDPRGGYVIGIGIGQMFQTVALADLGNDVVESTHLDIETVENPDRVVREAAWECLRLIGTVPDGRARVLGVLPIVTGRVDPATGGIVSAPYLGWGEYPLEERLAVALELPVRVQSMAATVAQAELLFGAARGRANVLTLIPELGHRRGDGAGGPGDRRRTLAGRRDRPVADYRGGRHPHRAGRSGGRSERSCGACTGRRWRSGARRFRRWRGRFVDTLERDRADDPEVAALMSAAGRTLGRAVVQFSTFNPPDLVLLAGGLSMSRRYVAAVREAVRAGAATRATEVLASGLTGALRPGSGGVSVSCAMAIYEFLVERGIVPPGGRAAP